MKNWQEMTDDEFEEEIQKGLKKEIATGEGFRNAEAYFSGPFKVEWHKVWREGKLAKAQGIKREDNPHKLKVWQAVWGYGWDDFNPVPAQFYETDQYLKTLPTRPMTKEDF